jgi:hypothetical protein
MCLSNSQDADSMSMCQSNSPHCDAVMGGSTVLKSYYQTKIVEGGTKDEMRISNEALFNGQLPKLSTPTIEPSFCCSSFKIFVWEG